MTLGQTIKRYRTELGLSQPALAEQVGIEQSYLSKLENDKSVPSNEIFRKLLMVFHTNITDFLSSLERNYIREHLLIIADVEQWLNQASKQYQVNKGRWLLGSAFLIAIGVTFFYTGFNAVLFSNQEHTYKSEGIVFEGEPIDYFDGGAFSATPQKLHKNIRTHIRTRYSPDYIKTHRLKGDDFVVDVENGQRRYMYVRSTEVTRDENSWLEILGVFMTVMGSLGFVLEPRLNTKV